MGKPSSSREPAYRNGADIKLVSPPLPVLDRPLAAALLTLLQNAAGEQQPRESNPRQDEPVPS